MAETPGPYRFERLIMLALAVALVVVLVTFVFLNPTLNSTTRLVLFVLVAMSAGGFVAFLPGGALQVGNDFKGLAIKATGGAAAFVIVLWLLFTYVEKPDPVELLPINPVDLRSENPPTAANHQEGRAVVVLPIGFAEPGGGSVQVRDLHARLSLGPTPVADFTPSHITSLDEGLDVGPWIPFKGPYASGAEFGNGKSAALVFYPNNGMRWSRLIELVEDAGTTRALITVSATLTDGTILEPVTCGFDLTAARATAGYFSRVCT